ncbi:MAG TPA: RDD family protein, partial [Flavobacteriaceae bacterium]|nr:RDD family protein [Flavobacteriaceae bacterium]
GGYSMNGLPALVPVLFWFIMTVGLESGMGATLGNSIAGLKAIPMSGINRKLTFIESLKRRLLDPIDMFLLGLPAIIVIKNTEKNQRIGDLWAKTIVMKESVLKEETQP